MSAIATETDMVNLALGKLGEYRITSMSDGTAAAEKASFLYESTRDALLRRHNWNFARMYTTILPAYVTPSAVAAGSDGSVQLTTTAAHGLSTGARVTVDLFTTAGVELTTGTFYVTVLDANNFTLNDTTWTAESTGGGGNTSNYTVAPPFKRAYILALPSDCLMVRTINGWKNAGMARRSFDIVQGGQVYINTNQGNLVYTMRMTTISEYDSMFVQCLAQALAIDLSIPITGDKDVKAALIQEMEQVVLPAARYANAIEPTLEVISEAYENPSIQARRGFYGYGYGANVGAEPPLYFPG